MTSEPKKLIVSGLADLRQKQPLVHNITNYVVMNTTANALLAIGASPIMAHAPEEVCDLVDICSVLVVNIGTLSAHWIDAMEAAMAHAKSVGKPIVLDPVGAGATGFRTDTVKRLLDAAVPTVIRGNGSEIMSLVDATMKTRGVDSSADSQDAVESAGALATELGCVVCVSGATDHITNGAQTLTVENGSELMPRVTGMGCTATALIGAFVATGAESLGATLGAMAVMGVAGEIAAERSAGPGSMQMNFLDVLHQISGADIENRFRGA